jgi:hypothetical protein
MTTSCLLAGLLVGLPMGVAHATSPLAELLDPDTIGVSITDSSTDPSPTVGETQPLAPAPPPETDTGCTSDGVVIPCKKDGWWWDSEVNRYCHVWDLAADSPMWDQYRDSQGNPTGVYYECGDDITLSVHVCAFAFWADDRVATPPIPGSEPVALVRAAVDKLQLHPPTVGVGAYTYPKYEQWGLSWWVGAPMWLWVDPDDPLQWGTHTLDAHLDADAITATITWQVTWSTTDGQYGQFDIEMASTSNPTIHVGQIHAVTVG